jgi:hypothetical protein
MILSANGIDYSRMAGWANEIQAGMDSHINLSIASRLLFLSHEAFVLIIQKFNDGFPVILIVHIVTETRGVNNCELNFE